MSKRTGLEVAIIGMAGRFPGGQNYNEFWRSLSAGKDSISTFSKKELKESGISEDVFSRSNYIPKRAIIGDIEFFDNKFFNYSKAEVEVMDPQLRIFHEAVWEALEDAAICNNTNKCRIGLYAGAARNYYWEFNNLRQMNDTGHAFSSIQLSNIDFMCTQISYKFNFNGPSVFIKSACSTSLAAVHIASRALLTGECDIALAGGVSVAVPQKTGYSYSKELTYSKDGSCRPFDAGASGFVVGDGAGVVVLKPLKKALEDKNHIHAVIKGSAVNNDGSKKMSFSTPGVEGQTAVIKKAVRLSRVQPDSVGYVEMHGTATDLGDALEVMALNSAYGITGKQSCGIGSVKSNIGHLHIAAGIAGLIKTVLCLKNKKIPPSIHYNSPNPKINFKDSPFFVVDKLMDWKNGNSPRIAGVSSFGIGGTNVHMLLEEAPEVENGQVFDNSCVNEKRMIPLSADSAPALLKICENLLNHISTNRQVKLEDIAYTLQSGRTMYSSRYVINASSIDQLREKLLNVKEDLFEKIEQKSNSLAFIVPDLNTIDPELLISNYYYFPGFKKEFLTNLEQANKIIKVDVNPGTDIIQRCLIGFIACYSLLAALAGAGIRHKALICRKSYDFVTAALAGLVGFEDAVLLINLKMKGEERSADSHKDFLGELKKKPLKKLKADVICYDKNTIHKPVGINKIEYWDQGIDLSNFKNESWDDSFIYIDMGDSSVFYELIGRTPGNPETASYFSLSSGNKMTNADLFCEILGELWLLGVDLNWEELSLAGGGRSIPLPPYPFQKKYIWKELDLGFLNGNFQSVNTPSEISSGFKAEIPKYGPACLLDHNEVVRIVCRIFLKYLDMDELDVDKSIFSLGLSSSDVLSIYNDIKSALDMEFSVTIFYKGLTVDELIYTISHGQKKEEKKSNGFILE